LLQLEETPVDFAGMVHSIEEDIGTPYVTIPTRSYAKLCATIEFLGGTALDVVGDAPFWPGFSPEPEHPEDPPEPHATAKALQLISWGKNGLKAIDKAEYELLLRMTKTRPGENDAYTRVNLTAIGDRLGVCPKTASNILWGLVDLQLLDAVAQRDPNTGHRYIMARAGRMPVCGETYRELPARLKDAARKRVCLECGGEQFLKRVIVTYSCVSCGTVQQEVPHSEDLIDALGEAKNTPTDTFLHGPTEESSWKRHGSLPRMSDRSTSLVETNSKGLGEIHDFRSRKLYRIGPSWTR
jgi:hypothetical protein